MISKSDRIRAAWAAGDRISALRIAARFVDRSVETKVFKRGMDAYNNPSFYRQLGKDLDRIIAGSGSAGAEIQVAGFRVATKQNGPAGLRGWPVYFDNQV
jgi:hypothetical protein